VLQDIFMPPNGSQHAYNKSEKAFTFTAMPYSPIAIAVNGRVTGRYLTPDDYHEVNAKFEINGVQRAKIGGSSQITYLKNMD